MHPTSGQTRIYTVRQDYKTLFTILEKEEPSAELSAIIKTRIRNARTRQARIRFFSVSTISLVSLIAFVPIVRYVGSEMQTSGFSSYMSTLFSSGQSAFMDWKEFGLALIEALPVFGVALLLTTVLAFLSSLKVAIKNVYVARLSF